MQSNSFLLFLVLHTSHYRVFTKLFQLETESRLPNYRESRFIATPLNTRSSNSSVRRAIITAQHPTRRIEMERRTFLRLSAGAMTLAAARFLRAQETSGPR